MKLIDIYSEIKRMKKKVFQTNDIGALLNINPVHVSKILARLEQSGHLMRVKRGVWILPENFDPLALPEYLTHPFPSYISLQSALYLHGMISQIPQKIYCISIARTHLYQTKLGTYSVHHINPSFFFGFHTTPETGIKIATPEKALLDFLYLSPTKSGLFKLLPELELPQNFSLKTARQIIHQLGQSSRSKILSTQFNDLLTKISYR